MDLNKNSLHLSTLRITISSCFAGSTCGICGYYDGDTTNELVIRDDPILNSLSTLTNLDTLSNPFDKDTTDIISQFTEAWLNTDRNTKSNIDPTTCDDYASGPGGTLCKLNFCDDECQCSANADIQTFGGLKRQQCDYDLAACLGFLEGSQDCIDWQNSDAQSKIDYLDLNAPQCGDLVYTYCCFDQFCPSIPAPEFCSFQARPTNPPPSQAPTPSPTKEPTPEPTESPSKAPTAGPTPTPIRRTPSPTIRPSERPTGFVNIVTLCCCCYCYPQIVVIAMTL